MSDIVEHENEEELEAEELPILTAQRFLNIFRQIHIFSEKKKHQFDEELLALPSEVIKALAGIPGASLLLNHIDELKGFSGNVQITKPEESSAKTSSKAGKKAKQAAETEDNQQVFTPMFNAAAAQGQFMPMQLGENFSEELSSALVNAFEKIESKHNTEMATLMNGMITTLNAIANKLGTVAITSEDGVAMPVVHDTNFDGANIAELINGVMSAQTQMFSKAVSEQTKAIAEVIVNGLKNQVSNIPARERVAQPRVQHPEPAQIKATEFVEKESAPMKPVARTVEEVHTPVKATEPVRKDPMPIKKAETVQEKEPAPSVKINKTTAAESKEEKPKHSTVNVKKEPEIIKEEVSIEPDEDTDENWSWDKLDDIQAAIEKDAEERKVNPIEEPSNNGNTSNDDDILNMVGELIDLNDGAEEINHEKSDFVESAPEPEEIEEPKVPSPIEEKEPDADDWEWEYDGDHPEEADAATEESGGEEDWEWEYEEVPEGDSENQQSDEDWEWEYEEDTDKK